jgi:chitinase
VPDSGNGLFQSHDKKRVEPPGGGEWTYRTIVENALSKMQRFWHPDAKVPWLFDAKTGVMISYDDPESLRIKAEFARDQHFAGVMIWEISQDDDQFSLLKALNAGLQGK